MTWVCLATRVLVAFKHLPRLWRSKGKTVIYYKLCTLNSFSCKVLLLVSNFSCSYVGTGFVRKGYCYFCGILFKNYRYIEKKKKVNHPSLWWVLCLQTILLHLTWNISSFLFFAAAACDTFPALLSHLFFQKEKGSGSAIIAPSILTLPGVLPSPGMSPASALQATVCRALVVKNTKDLLSQMYLYKSSSLDSS